MPTSTKKKTGAKRPSRKARTGTKRSAPGAKPRRRASGGKAAPKKAAPKKAAPKKAAPKKSSSAKTSPKAAGARKDKPKRSGRVASPAKGTKARGAKAGGKRRGKAATPPAGRKGRKTASPQRGQSSAGKGRSFVAGAASPGSSNRVPTTSVESQPPTTQRSRAGANQQGKALRSSMDPPKPPQDKRNFGLRGAAPWVARHAAKHAAELRRRNAQPPPPGSARATLREPEEAAQIKADVGQLHQRITKIRSLCRRLDRAFFEVGELLAEIQREQLHVAKGYSSFEAFIDRETDLGRTNALRLIRIAHTFVRETAYDYGIERLTAALAALDGEVFAGSPSQPSSRSFSSPGLPAKPPIRYGE